MKNILSTIIFYLALTSITFANCDFERLGLGTGSEMVESIYSTQIEQDPNNFSLSSSSQKGISGNQICNDEKFRSVRFNFFFISHQLHLISATDDTDTVNHLENLTSYYGSPSNQRVSASVDGTDDYHWNFDQKDVFLQVIRDNGKIRNNIKIISKDYIPLLESFKDFENDIY